MRDTPFVLLALVSALAGCAGTEPTAATATLPVVQAYLYAGEPVTAVRVTSTVGIGASDTVGVPVNDATVTLARGGVSYALIASAGDSGYYHYPDTDLVIAVGDTFDLRVEALDRVATARAIVPEPPSALTLSDAELVVPTFGGGFDPEDFTLVARWPNDAGELYFVVTQNIEASPTDIATPGPRFRFTAPPTAADSAVVIAFSFTQYGRHRLTLYRVNSEYAALYESRNQDSRDLNEPATNLIGGLGVFTAFSSRSAEFTVR